MEKVDKRGDDNPEVNSSLKFSKPSGRPVVTLENISKSYPNLAILQDTREINHRGDKIALMQAEGKGNSTSPGTVIDAYNEYEGKSIEAHKVSKTFLAQRHP